MTARIAVPSTTHQLALNASNMLRTAAMALNGTSSYQSLAQAEVMAKRARDDAMGVLRMIPALKRQAKEAERQAAADRAVIERSRKGVTV